MKYCPKCKYEYYDTAEVCSDCGEKLLVKEEEQKPERQQVGKAMRPVKVKNAVDQLQANMMIEMLQNNQIQAISKSKESGDYLNIYQGYSVFGEDIYVDEEQVAQAKEILSVFDQDDESGDSDSYTKDEIKVPCYKKRAFIARVIVGYCIASALIAFLIGIFINR